MIERLKELKGKWIQVRFKEGARSRIDENARRFAKRIGRDYIHSPFSWQKSDTSFWEFELTPDLSLPLVSCILRAAKRLKDFDKLTFTDEQQVFLS